MDLWPTHVYLDIGRKNGRPLALLQEGLAQAHAVQELGHPAVLSLRHLASRSDVAYARLREYVELRGDGYRTYWLRKRSGGLRKICVPAPALLRVQTWLTKHILNHVAPHPASSAYAPGSSVVSCARRHCGCRWLLKLDIHNFFESISEIQAYRVYRGLGYNRLLSFEMSRLCTRRDGNRRRNRSAIWQARQRRYHIGAYRDQQVGFLPQGAPSSPMLSNLAMRDLDAIVTAIARREGFEFSRYADDLALSSSAESIHRGGVLRVLREVSTALRKNGLILNRAKTVIAPPGSRKIVLGLLVDGPAPRLQRDFKDRLETHLFYARKFGAAAHARRRHFHSMWSMYRHVQGLIAYARQVEPEFAASMHVRMGEIDWEELGSTAT